MPDKARYIQRPVRCTRVVDGDTFTGDINLGLGVHLRDVYFRVLGFDTPERGQPGFYAAKARFEELLPTAPWIALLGSKKGKYGRILIRLPNICETMIAEGHAKRYGT